jgi:hypothetical protein
MAVKTHRPEVADVFRSHGKRYLETYGKSTSRQQLRVLKDIISCRTAALGGHVSQCDTCGHQEVYYNSCRNRHCPKCQAAARAQWLEARAGELLDVQYFHVVFTLPEELSPIALQNKPRVYGMLFRCVAETLQTIAGDPRHLGGEIGFIAILHTWGQTMHHHPHVHCVVPGGGLSPDRKRWVSCRKDFFLPVAVLSRLFRGKFLAYLEEEYKSGKLLFHGAQEYLNDRRSWTKLLRSLRRAEWVVYSKPPFGGPSQVLKYLARYTHRAAISHQRLVSVNAATVTFRWKDYADDNKEKTMTLQAVEFIRRFLQHVLPSGFVRLRHYGFLSNRNRNQKLPLCRQLIGCNRRQLDPHGYQNDEINDITETDRLPKCPSCKKGHMMIVGPLEPDPEWVARCKSIVTYDTS